MGDDDAGGESHPMAYIDDAGAAVPHEDVEFFFDEFTKLGPQFGCHLNTVKTRITTCSTSGSSALPAIEHEYGTLIADSLRRAIVKYSVSEVPLSRAQTQLPSIESHYGFEPTAPIRQAILSASASAGVSTRAPSYQPSNCQHAHQYPNGNRHRNSSSRPTTWIPILRQVLLCPTSPGEHGRCNKAPRNCL